MKFSTLFGVTGKGVEIEVYEDTPASYICSVSGCSKVPSTIWKSDVEKVVPVDSNTMIVIVRREVRK